MYLSKFGVYWPSPLIFNHTVRYHNPRAPGPYRLLDPGGDSVRVLEKHGRADLMRDREDVFDDKYAMLGAHRPSKTIVAHLAKVGNGYVHPIRHRSISLREAARAPSFHDGFAFCGSRARILRAFTTRFRHEGRRWVRCWCCSTRPAGTRRRWPG